jgi:AraC-like DNA-binding protein
MTIIDFYNMRRLTIAEQYITENILTLDQIAQKLNFATPYSLSKAFKKKYNLSPTHYRKLKNI